MHFTLVSSASALLLASYISSVSARAAKILAKDDIQYCTENDYYQVVATYLPAREVTPFCSGLLGITNVDYAFTTTTPVSIVYSTTVKNATVTGTITEFASTSTVTVTSTAYEIKKRDAAARAVVTPRAELLAPIYKQLAARQTSASSSTNIDLSAISLGLVSACSCLDLKPGTNYVTATARTLTDEEGVFGTATTTAFVTTVVPGITTVTDVVNSTSNVLNVTSSTSMSMSISSSTLIYNSTSSMDPSSISSTSTSSSPTSSTVVGPLPSGCPESNGTLFSTADPCQSYQIQCGTLYPASDFYDLEELFETLEMCASYVCTPANTGKTTPCLGVQWNADTGNCQELKSLANPSYDPYAVAAIGVRSNASFCQKNVSTSSSSTSSNVSVTALPTMMNTSTTWLLPTGTGSPKNHTWSYNGTWPTHNSTWSKPWKPTGFSGTMPSGAPTQTSNNTCPISTTTATSTIYGTLYATSTLTVYVGATNATNATEIVDVTITTTNFVTTSTDVTTTIVGTEIAISDTTSTILETDFATSVVTTKTVKTKQTTTLTATSTEIDVISDTTTTTTLASTETDIAVSTTTITAVSTATRKGRSAQSWWGVF